MRSDYEEIMEAMAPEGFVHSGRCRCGISVLPLGWLQLRKLRHYCQSLELHALHGIDRFSSVQSLERRVLQTMTKGVHFPFWHTISRVCRKWQTRFFRAIAPPFFRIVLPALNNIPGKRKNRQSLIETAGLWTYCSLLMHILRAVLQFKKQKKAKKLSQVSTYHRFTSRSHASSFPLFPKNNRIFSFCSSSEIGV